MTPTIPHPTCAAAAASLAALLLLAGGAAAAPVNAEGTIIPLPPGVTAPAFSLPDFAGKPMTLAEATSGAKLVIVDFWSTKCPVSRAYEGRLKAIAEEYAPKGVKVIAVMSNQTESASDVKAYLAETPLPYPVLIDAGSKIADLYGGQTTPHVFVVDPSGKIRYTGGIDDGAKSPETPKPLLREALDALLTGREPESTLTRNFGCSIKRRA